jgi:DNA (cytosine-5)-methyltransferase 1
MVMVSDNVIYMSNLLTIAEASKMLDVSPDTIRRWDKKGLIKARRDDNNYRVFNIDEIKRVYAKMNGDPTTNNYKILKTLKKSNYKVAELFSGAGGTALGLENAGLRHVILVEWDKDAVNSLRSNREKWNVIHEDISKVNFKGVDADIVEGGFPCQAFSYAGKKLGFEDTRGTLFFEFARAVKEIKPKLVIAENVKGLLRHDKGRTLETMVSALKEIGYKTSYKVLRSQYLDVPQKRERLIILAVREDLDLPFLFPKEKDYLVTIKEALQNVPRSKGYEYPDYKKKVMDMIPPGGYWKDLPKDIQKDYMGASYYHSGGRTGMARRLSWDEPSLTLTTSPAQKQTERCHPEETRPLTVREYARIQTFPDEWEFQGSTASQYKQIGNAVPVNLGYHIGQAAISILNNDWMKDDYLINEETPIEDLYHQKFLF